MEKQEAVNHSDMEEKNYASFKFCLQIKIKLALHAYAFIPTSFTLL